VATINRLLKIIGPFCRISSLSQGSFAKETYNLKEPTNCRYSLRPYGVATINRLLKIISPFCRISSLSQGSFAKETYNLKEPTNCRHQSTRNVKTSCIELRITLRDVFNLRIDWCLKLVGSLKL